MKEIYKNGIIKDNLKRTIIMAAIAVVLLLLPLVVNVGNYIMSLMVMFFIYAILSQSWNLMGGYAGQVNLGLAAYFGTGAFIANYFYNLTLYFSVAMIVGAIAAAILACFIGPITLRLKGAYFGIGTLAVAEVMKLIMSNKFSLQRFPPKIYWQNYSLLKAFYLAAFIAIITYFIAYKVVYSRLGLTLQAIRDEEDAANATGINPARYKMIVFLISSFIAGLAGGVFAYYSGTVVAYTQYEAGKWSINPLIAATIGGTGTIFGPAVGSLLLTFMQEILGRYIRDISLILTGLGFILVIMFMPNGLIRSGINIRELFISVLKRSYSSKKGK